MKLDELMSLDAKFDGYEWDKIKAAIEAGEDVNAEHEETGTPYSWHFGKCPPDALASALDHGIKVDSMLITNFVISGNIECLEMLVSKGIKLNQQPEVKKGFSAMGGQNMELVPFMGLFRKFDGQPGVFSDIAKLLLENEVDVNAQDSAGRTPLFLAAIQDNVPLVEFLLNHGADKQHKNVDGKRAFDLADKKAACRSLIK